MEIIDKGLNYGDMNYSNKPNTLILHHIEAEGPTWTVGFINNMHRNEKGWAAIGYHYYIRLDGTIYKGRPDSAIGAHCKGYNMNSLGIAFEGNYDKRTEMPTSQFNAWCELKAHLFNNYGSMSIYGHREKGSSECPGKYFPLERCKECNKYKLGWNQNSTGWWYCTDIVNGYYYKDSWKQIDGEWYSFDSDGYARCNTWLEDKGYWFYLQDNCVMARNEWLWIDGECYYFGDQGGIYVNSLTPDGYRVDEYGTWVE